MSSIIKNQSFFLTLYFTQQSKEKDLQSRYFLFLDSETSISFTFALVTINNMAYIEKRFLLKNVHLMDYGC